MPVTSITTEPQPRGYWSTTQAKESAGLLWAVQHISRIANVNWMGVLRQPRRAGMTYLFASP